MNASKVVMLIGVVSLAVAPMKAQERLRPGQWEIVFTGDNPHTSTSCFTAAMTQGINGSAAAVRADTEKTAAARKFTVQDYKFDGTTLSYTAVGAQQTFVNTASYHGDTFESLIITRMGGKESTTRQKGKRLGACP